MNKRILVIIASFFAAVLVLSSVACIVIPAIVKAVNGKDGQTSSSVANVTPDAPSNFKFDLDGQCVDISWDEAKNATSYEFNLNGKVITCSKNSAGIRKVTYGKKIEMSFRSVNANGSETTYSDWVNTSYTAPSINTSKLSVQSCVLASKATLEKVAEANGYSVSTNTENDMVVVTLSKKDSENTGFLNGALRTLVGGVRGVLGQDDLSGLDSIINRFSTSIANNNSISKSFKAAVAQGISGAITGACNAAFDNYITYTFYYEDVDRSPNCCIMKELQSGHELEKNLKQKYSTDSKGRYIIESPNFQKQYLADVSKITENGLAKWAVCFYKK